ncbi:hypothetical protein CRM22_010677 [Opisthorchis felineus]|uniref:thiopurine S-methyltransferase n=1 Tax=Opisthorchis felineus TaxID=147828 RepID=A0A4S2KVQ1_OPIFE|nr:hypothetical protein CRM22_010677 [Opisthorchis felineus]
MEDTFSADAWCRRWDSNTVGWHSPVVHRHLQQFWDKFCPESTLEKLVFVPLCGKSLDLAWMYFQKSCTVVGCELSETALKAFVAEHPDLRMLRSTIQFRDGRHISLFHTPDRRIRLYLCNLFDMDQSSEPPFKFIWDRGSLVAMAPSQRSKYVNYVSKLAAPDVRWLLETVDYPEGVYGGPPCRMTDEEYDALFGSGFTSELLAVDDMKIRPFENAAYCYVRITLLVKKSV